MEIREYRPEDLTRIKELHAKCGFDYEMPDLDSPSIPVKRVIEEGGQVQMGGILRLTAEAMLLTGTNWRTPAWRWEMLKELHEDMRRKAELLMLHDVYCWLPPQVEKPFGKRLEALGWAKERPWAVYSVRL